MDSKHFRKVFGQFATGVTVIVGTDDQGERTALTATSFNTVSLDPPLVVFSVKKNGYAGVKFRECRVFVINVLAEDHRELSDLFGRPSDASVRQAALDSMMESGVARLAGALAALHCEPFMTQEVGDHALFVVRVTDAAFNEGRKPLLFFSSEYRKLLE
ncbi:nitrilotriacetate monooxygenase component B [Gluconacetobacter sacchari DSM 12717]|uniref:Nitrilotriacetate monooxygenase component B n=1 Tax=Gluconacetobacter sacchari DSM 12717 TaxID=1307940 RepID=A0ABQ0P699_9PROT|nr:flavin reductase family protein [Gluconacetobacter sacchari]GBQ22965.1 nitrilotriacetate monooxygenase component B [Gluconacetobacter sacchari DSM 12717]